MNNNTIFKYNPMWYKKSKIYKINDLAFKGEWALKNSDIVKELIIPTDTMEDIKNPKKDYLWERYKSSALYTNYPSKYLKQAEGLVTKEKFEVTLPDSMESLIDYATLENLSLQALEIECLQSIIKFGSCLLITRIPDEVEIATSTPKIECIPGCDVLDAEAVYNKDAGLDVFKRVVYYKQEYIFDENTNSYTLPQIFIYVKALDFEGRYYEAKMKEEFYPRFNLKNPIESKDSCISLSYPIWTDELKFVPVVFANKENLKLEWKESPIQNLIDISLSIFQLTADMRFLMHQQSSATLLITGTDIEGKVVRTGVGSVINLVEPGSAGSFIAPSVAGLQAMQNYLTEQHQLAQSDLLTLTDAGAGSSGEALALRMNDKTAELIGIVSLIGKAIQRELEMIGYIMNEDINKIIFTPYIGFGQLTGKEEKNEVADVVSDSQSADASNSSVDMEEN